MLDERNIEVHRELLAAIEQGEGPALEAAIRRHNENQASRGMFREQFIHT